MKPPNNIYLTMCIQFQICMTMTSVKLFKNLSHMLIFTNKEVMLQIILFVQVLLKYLEMDKICDMLLICLLKNTQENRVKNMIKISRESDTLQNVYKEYFKFLKFKVLLFKDLLVCMSLLDLKFGINTLESLKKLLKNIQTLKRFINFYFLNTFLFNFNKISNH